jgi:hypothetical protein
LYSQPDLMGRRNGFVASAADTQEGAESHGYGGYAVTAYDDECCPPVVDPFTVLALLGFIAAGTAGLFALNQSVFGRRRRDFGPVTGWMVDKYREGVEYIMFHKGETDSASCCGHSYQMHTRVACLMFS